MHFVGFLRSQQGNITGYIAALIALAIVYFCIRAGVRFFLTGQETESSIRETISKTKHIFVLVGLLATVVCVVNALSMFVANNTPRSDVNGSEVFRQMNSN